MLSSKPNLPLHTRLFNATEPLFRALKIPIAFARLDEETLTMTAWEATGLNDLGDQYYREGLLQLLASAEVDANLTFWGRLKFQKAVVTCLINRLLLMETKKRFPEIFDRKLKPPIIILGTPRSGTTLLHRMLALDPGHRGIPLWEAMRPIPSWHGDQKKDQRRKIARKRLKLHRVCSLNVDHKHYTRVDEVAECIWMLGATFQSGLFWVLFPVFSYAEWSIEQDKRKVYREYEWFLKVLQAAYPALRLVLKAPAHTSAISAIREFIPEAMIIQSHRDPIVVCNSLNSLLYTLHSGVTKEIDVAKMANVNLRLLEKEQEFNLRARNDERDNIMDVYYERFVSDPVETIKNIYDHFKLSWSDEFESRLKTYLRENPKGKHGKHRYSSTDFGLSESTIARRMEAYRERFGFT